MLDVELFGMNSGAIHFINVIYHTVNSILLLYIFARITGNVNFSVLVASLFAFHPLHVESVVWISERKDLLSAFFFFVIIIVYSFYVKGPNIYKYFCLVIFLVLGLMSKPMLVTTPFVLLLLDWWPFSRVSKCSPRSKISGVENGYVAEYPVAWLIKEKLPLVFLCFISSYITIIAQRKGGAIASLDLSLSMRIYNAVVSYAIYLYKLVWPCNLGVFYPYQELSIQSWHVWVSLVLLLMVTLLSVSWIRKRPWFAVGWYWYLGMLFPVIGLVQVGAQGMADRYTYLPLIGIFIIFSWFLIEYMGKVQKGSYLFFAINILIIVPLAMKSYVQLSYWKDTEKLFLHTINVTNKNWLMHNNYGEFLRREGRLGEALDHLNKSISINPKHASAWNNYGAALAQSGQTGNALEALREAVRQKPDYETAWNNLGNVYSEIGRVEESIIAYKKAISLKNDFFEPWYNLGVVLFQEEKYFESANAFREALRIRPNDISSLGYLKSAEALARER
jgi:tetratricopeptide (TPR) repeat protein